MFFNSYVCIFCNVNDVLSSSPHEPMSWNLRNIRTKNTNYWYRTYVCMFENSFKNSTVKRFTNPEQMLPFVWAFHPNKQKLDRAIGQMSNHVKRVCLRYTCVWRDWAVVYVNLTGVLCTFPMINRYGNLLLGYGRCLDYLQLHNEGRFQGDKN